MLSVLVQIVGTGVDVFIVVLCVVWVCGCYLCLLFKFGFCILICFGGCWFGCVLLVFVVLRWLVDLVLLVLVLMV